MLEMREISLKHKFLLHLIHVSGSIIIPCFIDGLSRGDLQIENLDEEIYLHLPVNRDPIFRGPTLLTWTQSWISDPFSLAGPSDWISRSQHTHSASISSQSELWFLYFHTGAALDTL